MSSDNSHTANSRASVHLISDIDETGKNAYYFIKVPQEKLPEFLELANSDSAIDLNDFGEVVYSAYGDYPPAYVQEWVKEKHGWQG